MVKVLYRVSYFGEKITDFGMTGPMAIFALISWLLNPYNDNRAEVAVNRLGNRELVRMYALIDLGLWQRWRISASIHNHLLCDVPGQ